MNDYLPAEADNLGNEFNFPVVVLQFIGKYINSEVSENIYYEMNEGTRETKASFFLHSRSDT